MIYFCADDYGISKEYNRCIELGLKDGALNKISVLPNGDISDLDGRFDRSDARLALHINLVEGAPLSSPEEVSLLIGDEGYFKYSFIGLLLLSLSPKRKELKKQVYNEIRSQIRFWKEKMGEGKSISIDSHQHVYMIPLIFGELVKVIKDEGVDVKYLRIPAEPLSPFLLTPSLYSSYKPTGIVKQWLLKFFALINRRKLRKTKIETAYFMGVMFSGKMNEARVRKLLFHYLKLAQKHNKNIEIGFHPGCSAKDEELICGSRKDFKKFYCSHWRNIELETLISLNKTEI